jgi:hypothetical protein
MKGDNGLCDADLAVERVH